MGNKAIFIFTLLLMGAITVHSQGLAGEPLTYMRANVSATTKNSLTGQYEICGGKNFHHEIIGIWSSVSLNFTKFGPGAEKIFPEYKILLGISYTPLRQIFEDLKFDMAIGMRQMSWRQGSSRSGEVAICEKFAFSMIEKRFSFLGSIEENGLGWIGVGHPRFRLSRSRNLQLGLRSWDIGLRFETLKGSGLSVGFIHRISKSNDPNPLFLKLLMTGYGRYNYQNSKVIISEKYRQELTAILTW